MTTRKTKAAWKTKPTSAGWWLVLYQGASIDSARIQRVWPSELGRGPNRAVWAHFTLWFGPIAKAE